MRKRNRKTLRLVGIIFADPVAGAEGGSEHSKRNLRNCSQRSTDQCQRRSDTKTSPTPVAGLNASIGSPLAMAMDTASNDYFTSLNCVFKLDPNGT